MYSVLRWVHRYMCCGGYNYTGNGVRQHETHYSDYVHQSVHNTLSVCGGCIPVV